MDKSYIGPRSSIPTNLATVGVVGGVVAASSASLVVADALEKEVSVGAELRKLKSVRQGAAAAVITADALMTARYLKSPDSPGAGAGPGAGVGAALGGSYIGVRLLLDEGYLSESAARRSNSLAQEAVYLVGTRAGATAMLGLAAGMGLSFFDYDGPFSDGKGKS